jgi:hypothetical protein
MKIRNIHGRFFFGVKESADFETGTEWQIGQDKKRLGLLFFNAGRNQRRPMLVKSKLRRYLIAKHKNP